MTPYEQCLSFYRRWASDYHMTPAEIDESDLELLLDMEVLDSKIDAAFAEKSKRQSKTKKGKHVPFSGGTAFIDQIMNF